MPRFGMPALIEMESLEESAALCRALGLSFIELNMNFPQYQMDAMDVSRLREIGERYGIFYTLHLDDNMNVADFNPLVAGAYQDTVVAAVELAKELNIPVLNMHLSMGGVVTLPERKVYLFDQYREAYRQRIIQFRDRCEQAVGHSGVRICVENTYGYPQWQREAVEILLKSPVFGLTLDVGHDFCTGVGDLDFIQIHRERLRHIHLHDAMKPNRDHLALGTGNLDLDARLALAKDCHCSVVLEIKTIQALKESVVWLQQNL